NRVHEADDGGERMARIIRETAERGGKVIIPAFALGRIEEVLYWINRLEEERRIPVLPVFVDSPMARAVLEIYSGRLHEMDTEILDGARSERFRKLCAFCTAKMTVIASVPESREVQESSKPAIVLSSSGMATGGRVLHHLARALPDERNTVL